MKARLIVFLGVVVCAGCSAGDDAATKEEVSPQPVDTTYQSPGKPIVVPVDVKYRLLDTPEVGKPLGLELTLMSSVETSSMGYGLQPEDGLVIDQAELAASFAGKTAMTPQTTTVSITPQREGRFYLRVAANIVVNGERKTRTITIPIQVGAGTRELETMGEIKVDAEGNRVISLPSKEDTE